MAEGRTKYHIHSKSYLDRKIKQFQNKLIKITLLYNIISYYSDYHKKTDKKYHQEN